MAMNTTPGREAIQRRLGLADARGPEGMFSRGANTYRGGLPFAHAGSGNPNMGRPSMNPVDTGMKQNSPSLTALVGSLPPLGGNQDGTMNDAVMNLLRNRQAQNPGVASG